MPFWNRNSDRKLEADLRGGRPQPGPEVTRAIADRVRPRRRGVMASAERMRYSMAGGLTAVALVAVIALGGVSAPLNAAAEALNLQNLSARSPSSSKVDNNATIDQYGPRLYVCVGGSIRLRLAKSRADHLIAGGLAVAGVCTGDVPTTPTGSRSYVCLDGYIQLRVSAAERASLVAANLVVVGKCSRS